MHTLTLEAVFASAKPGSKTYQAVNCALATYPANTRCCWAIGQPSHRKGSNARRTANAAGFSDYDIFQAAKRRYRTEGFQLLLVELTE